MTGANMQADSSKMGSGAADNGSGGLHNLFALAHLAAMSEEERGIAARSPPTTTATASATSQSKDEQENAATRTPSPPNRMAGSRRPAKKRAVPADFDAVDMAPQEHNGTTGVSIADGAPFESPSNKSPKVSASAPAVAATSPSTSSTKPPTTTKRPRKIKSKTMSSSAKSQQQHQRKGSNTFKMKANQPSFPVILMAILSAPQNREFVTFLGDGKRFIIIQPRALARNVLPMHFEENVPSFDQFLYLLAIWGFETVKDPGYPQVNVYKHPMFRNGDWEACLQIKLPNPNDQQAALKNQAAKASSSPTQNGHATRNIPALPDPASPRLNAADVQANNDLSPGTMARSVTPPMEIKSLHSLMHQPHFLSDATLLERVAATQNVATQTSQHQRQQQFSNLGPKYTGMKENLMYRHLLQESGMLVQDQASVFLQTQLHRDISLGRKSSMMGYSHPTVSRGAMPMNHRRATLGMPPSNSCDVANFPSMNHRRATLDMLPSFSMSGNNAMATGMMGGQMPSHFAPSFHHGHQPPQQQMPSQRMQAPIMNTTPSATTPSDAEVRSATEDIVSKAMDALRSKNNVSRRLTIEHPPTSHGGTARLDAMTDVFLERSLARLSGNRPTMGSMMGGSRNSPMQQQPDVPSMQQHQQAFMAREDGMMSRQQHSLIAAASVSAAEEACIAAAAQALGRHHSHRKVSILGHMPLSYGR